MQDILINIEAGERRVAVLQSKKLEWYFVERINEKGIVGNIYKGVVTSVLSGMAAAFVDFGVGKNGFIYVSDIMAPRTDEDDVEFESLPATQPKDDSHRQLKITELLKKGQEILVQVEKDQIGTKGARLTTHISLPGRYLVLMPTSNKIGVSRKIRDDAERKRIRAILKEMNLPGNIGFVVRTAAEGCDKRQLLRDVRFLLDTYNRINKISKNRKGPALIYEELDLSLKMIRDFLNDDTEKVIIDDSHEFRRIRHLASRIEPKLGNRVQFYQEQYPLFDKYGIEDEIDKLFERKVPLKCGGYITLEQTEGMVSIDVNSGKFTGKKSLEDTVFKVNCEAAEEVARQLRLRDVGGIIIIDFIDMEIANHRREVFSILQNALKKDKARTNIISFSELNIVEMTRQRVRKSLESASYQDCPYCFGKGRVKSVQTMAVITARKLRAYLKANRQSRAPVEAYVHPLVAQRLVNEDSSPIDMLKKVFRRHISVVVNDKLHLEDVEIVTTAPPKKRFFF